MLGLILAFVRSPIGKYALGAAAILASLTAIWLLGYHHGRDVEKSRQARAEAAAEAKVRQTEQKAEVVTQQIAAKAEAAQAEIRTVTRTIIERVPEHVTPQMDRSVSVPVGFVRVFNAAASGVPDVPAPAGQPDDAPSGIALSAVASATADNFGTCREEQARLKGLQDWIAAQAALH